MLRRRHMHIGIGLGLLTLATVGLWLAYRASREPFSVRAYHRIALGMTRHEVESAVGMPPGNYAWDDLSRAVSFAPVYIHAAGHDLAKFPSEAPTANWYFRDFWISITFDENDRVIRTELTEAPTSNMTWFEWAQQWLSP